jgi:uncharacterized protein (DUF1330 family)
MSKHRFEVVLALALLALFAAFWWWQTPGASSKLSRGEVEAFIRQIEPRLPIEAPEKAEVLARMRAWGEADDGQPVYMLNLMRFFDQLKRIPGAEAIQGTPAQANAHYEGAVFPMLTRLGGYPLVGGEVAGVRGSEGRPHSNLLAFDREVDDWNRVLVVRYPSRRAFFELISNPGYQDVMPYKLASLKVALIPVRAEAVVPDPRWIAGMVLLCGFLGIGWLRAARRR